jgi:hypothetical protein
MPRARAREGVVTVSEAAIVPTLVVMPPPRLL